MTSVSYFRKARSTLFNTFVILLITLLMGEIAFRVYNHYFPSYVFYSESYNRFRGKPFADDWDFKLNSQGYKDNEFQEKKEDVYRILGIGDSFSFGVVPYKNNYLTLLDSQLDEENSNIELLNLGIPSIGPKDYLSLLINEGLALKPDMVLLSFFVGNDFDESRRRKLYEYSYVASLFHYIANIQTKYEGTIIHGKAQYCDECPSFNNEQYLNIEFNRSFIYLEDNKRFSKYFNDAIHYLKQIKRICEAHSIKLVVVIIPDELQINQDLLKNVKEIYYPDVPSDIWNITLPNKMLSNELDKLSINNIDLYEYFSRSNEQLYRPRDTHWNIAGNQLATNIIQEHIRKYLTQ